jgi:hypothetical protein
LEAQGTIGFSSIDIGRDGGIDLWGRRYADGNQEMHTGLEDWAAKLGIAAKLEELSK